MTQVGIKELDEQNCMNLVITFNENVISASHNYLPHKTHSMNMFQFGTISRKFKKNK